jgi:hypothetical protein
MKRKTELTNEDTENFLFLNKEVVSDECDMWELETDILNLLKSFALFACCTPSSDPKFGINVITDMLAVHPFSLLFVERYLGPVLDYQLIFELSIAFMDIASSLQLCRRFTKTITL